MMFETLAPNDKPLSVSAFLQQVSRVLTNQFGSVCVTGEISSFSRYPSGHCYFDLKDSSAQIRCVLFNSVAKRILKQLPKVGDKVEVVGRPTIYSARGDLQLTISQIRFSGVGQLYEAFIQLKNKLEALGLFTKDRKKPLPVFPKKIGIVTSLQAAALRDVISTLSRRAPHTQLIVYPSAVQGASAADELINAIGNAISHNVCDVLIICRGGGSIEDLWCFNDEELAYTISKCPIPTISGVGHETDFTICDFVSDYRAETPTAAAEKASLPQADWQNQLSYLYDSLKSHMTNFLNQANQNLDYLCKQLPTPINYINNEQTRLNQLLKMLSQNTKQNVQNKQHTVSLLLTKLKGQQYPIESSIDTLTQLKERLSRAIFTLLENKKIALNHQQSLLASLGPDNIVRRGYAILQDKNRHIIRDPADIVCGEPVDVRLANGQATITINRVTPK